MLHRRAPAIGREMRGGFATFTSSVTNGIGAGFVACVVTKVVTGRTREVNWLVWITAALVAVCFAIDPVRQILGVS